MALRAMRRRLYTRVAYVFFTLLLVTPAIAGVLGQAIGAGVLHPQNLNPNRSTETQAMLLRTGAR